MVGDEHGERAARLLHSRGLRSTRARRAIIAELIRGEKPMSHGEMLVAVRALELDRATVYRVLIDLEGVGILARTDLGDRLWRFELRRKADHERDHPHFVCVTCQAVTCLIDASFALQVRSAGPKSLSAGTYAIRLSGVCDSCNTPPSAASRRARTAPTRQSIARRRVRP